MGLFTTSSSRSLLRLGTSDGWDTVRAVRLHAVEEISKPYTYDVTLVRDYEAGPLDLDALTGTPATVGVSAPNRWRRVHGVLLEVEEIERTPKLFLYGAILVPHLFRANFRRRCRNFVGRTFKDVVSSVLENKGPNGEPMAGGLVPHQGDSPPPSRDPDFHRFEPPLGTYRWEVSDESRITGNEAYPYLCQYNESDFAFVSRLLEREGLSYYFDQLETSTVMVITDAPKAPATFSEDETFDLRRLVDTGTHSDTHAVRSLRDVRRLRERSVRTRDFDYLRSRTLLETSDSDGSETATIFEHFEFPAGEESVKETPTKHASQIRRERHTVEARLRDGTSDVRTMEPGRVFELRDADGLLERQRLLAVRVETFVIDHPPEGTIVEDEPFGFKPGSTTATLRSGDDEVTFESRFVALPVEVPFRPAMTTPSPRIAGIQTAIVTAEEFAGARPKVNADKLARIRVRFPWDQRRDVNDQTPTSDWIRVSQQWAGAGYGGLHAPRVGHEVFMAFLQGDPERPVVLGRGYNGQNVPPYDLSKHPTLSTTRSQSTTGTEEVHGSNELRFDDQAKREQILLHAQRNLDEQVLSNHSTGVGGDQKNTVGGSQTNSVGGYREHTVDGKETVSIGGDRATEFKQNETHHVALSRTTNVDGKETVTVGKARETDIKGDETLRCEKKRTVYVWGNEDITTSGTRDDTVVKDYSLTAKDNRKTEVTHNDELHIGIDRTTKVDGEDKLTVTAGGRTVEVPNGTLKTTAKSYELTATDSITLKVGGTTLTIKPGDIELVNGAGCTVSLNQAILNLVGNTTNIRAASGLLDGSGAQIKMRAPDIELNPS